MIRIADSSRMGNIDSVSQERYGIPSIVLMENAGIKAWQKLKPVLLNEKACRLLIFTGKGNNGGDALVIARQAFMEGFSVRVVTAAESLKGDAEINRKSVLSLGIPVSVWKENREDHFSDADWILDGIAGTGISGALRGTLKEMTDSVNDSGLPVCSIDVPSGIGDEYQSGYPAVRARLTLTMGLPKQCLYAPASRPLCGEIINIGIGFPPDLVDDPGIPGSLWDRDDLPVLLGVTPRNTYKTKRGTLGVFCGGPGTAGAAVLSAQGAARARAGMVFLHVPETVYQPVAAKLASVLVYASDFSAIPEGVFSRYQALLAGPGMGTEAPVPSLIKFLISQEKPGVLDADGINVLSKLIKQGEKISLKGRWILTPHPGEFSRLSGEPVDKILENPLSYLRDTARDLNAVIVLKGHVTWIMAPGGQYRIIDGMEPSLATAGSGDVLAGIIAGLLSGGMEIEDAAAAGVLIHLSAGRRAFAERGWYLSEDLLPYVSETTAEAEGG
ncbi:MAG: NAD(P)H-hydrate dehydratase [Spirochaetia bacterium]